MDDVKMPEGYGHIALRCLDVEEARNAWVALLYYLGFNEEQILKAVYDYIGHLKMHSFCEIEEAVLKGGLFAFGLIEKRDL